MSETKPDLRILMAREQMLHFMNQLNAISSTPLSLMDSDGNVIYRNGALIEAEDALVDPQDSDLCFPLEIDDVQIGVIAAGGDAPAESMKHIGQMLADKLSYELKVDDLALEVIHSYQELNLLYNISETLGSILDAEAICDAVLKQAVSVICPKTAFMMLVDSDKKQLLVTASTDAISDLKGLLIKIENSIYESVVRDGTTLVVEDVEKYPHLKGKIDESSAIYATPLICVPVMVKGEASGVISMSGKVSEEPFTSEDSKLLYTMASQAGMSLGNARLYDDLQELFLSTVETLAAAVETRDPYTHGHCLRVAEYSANIGMEIGLTGKEIGDLRLAGILHDIGKIGMSKPSLRSSDSASEKELAELRNHPVNGARIIQHIQQMQHIAVWIRHHHERYDGTGYPDGLRGGEIPLHSRILAVADAYDNITLSRDQQARHPRHAALTKLGADSGSKLDSDIVNAFLDLIRENAYEQYMEMYRSGKRSSTPRLTRLAYYRIDNEIASMLARETEMDKLSDSEQIRVRELSSLILQSG